MTFEIGPAADWISDRHGEMGRLIAGRDWAHTSLGPASGWSERLRTIVDTIAKGFPAALLFGDDLVLIYNDSFRDALDDRHPDAFGQPLRTAWPEMWAKHAGVCAQVLASGESFTFDDRAYQTQRAGLEEDRWFTLSLCPVHLDGDAVAGVLLTLFETTGWNRALEDIRHSESRMHALVKATSQSVFRMSADWSELLQLDDGEDRAADAPLSTRDWLQTYIHPADRDSLMQVMNEATRTKSSLEFEHRIKLREGRTGWVQARAVPIIGDDGEIEEWFGAASDITERKQGEDQVRFLDRLGRRTADIGDADTLLAAATQMLGEHLRLSTCAYADMEPDGDGFTIRGDWHAPESRSIRGRYRLRDFGELAVTELSAGRPLVIRDNLDELAPHEAATFQAIGITATICMPLVKQGRLTALMAIHAATPRDWTEAELGLLTEVAERCWAHIERVRSAAAIREAERLFREELERKVEERTAALAQSEKSIRAIFETSHLYQGMLDAEGRLLHANSTALAGIRCSLADVQGRYFWDTPWFTATPGMPDLVRNALARVANGQPQALTVELTLPTGERQFEYSFRPVQDGSGQLVGIVPEAVDITNRLLTERALQQAQKMEAIGNLTGGVAHDFNNLLMAVSGSLELLRRRIPSEPQLMRLIDNAMEGVRRGSSLTQRMLAFARRQDLKTERVDISQLLDGMTEMMTRALGPMVSVEISAAPGMMVDIDPVQLESAVLSLAVNARDAMRETGVLRIAVERPAPSARPLLLKQGDYVCLSVTDDGEGMDPETLKRCVEPFFTTKGVGKGTGLGLSMIQGLAEQSGGSLVLKSRTGEGTRAEIWLPATSGECRTAITAGQPDKPEAPAQTAARCRILVVDDDPLVLMNTVDMLEDLGHDVISSSSGRNALEMMERWLPDVLVTDHAMPVMTGAELIARIRETHPHLPIIIATGYAELTQGGERAGLQNIPRLAKPFSQEDLAIVIAEVTGLSG